MPKVQGTYYGTPIYQGSDAEISAQMAKVDAKRQGESQASAQSSGKTVYSDVNVREKVIPDLESRMDKIAGTGQYIDNLGNKRNADGSIADDPREDEVKELEDDVDEIDSEVDSILQNLRKTTDADTLGQIGSISAQFEVRRQQQREINRRMEAGMETALLLGGSSRYAVSGDSLQAAQERAGVMELAEIDALEQSAIAAAKAAQASQNYKILEQELQRAEKIRGEKTKKASELAKKMADENKELREKQETFNNEFVIAELFQQGHTDPQDIQGILKEQGLPLSLSDIDDVLKIINPEEELKGLGTDYRTYTHMKEAGEIPEKWNYFTYLTAVGNASRKPDTGETTKSGTLNYTAQDKADDAAQLEASRGSDGWVNSALYIQLYQAWVKNGGVIDDFVKEFPPKHYVNPDDDSVPIYLRNTSKEGGGGLGFDDV